MNDAVVSGDHWPIMCAQRMYPQARQGGTVDVGISFAAECARQIPLIVSRALGYHLQNGGCVLLIETVDPRDTIHRVPLPRVNCRASLTIDLQIRPPLRFRCFDRAMHRLTDL